MRDSGSIGVNLQYVYLSSKAIPGCGAVSRILCPDVCIDTSIYKYGMTGITRSLHVFPCQTRFPWTAAAIVVSGFVL